MDDLDGWDYWRGPIRRIASLCPLALALCMALGLAPAALAAPAMPAMPAMPAQARAALAPAAPSASGHVTVIVLDMSGSMAQNDPLGLRCSAAGAYVDLSGPSDFVGVVGLDNPNGATGGPRNFPTTIDWQLPPRELSTVSARQSLRAAIQQKSNSCHPDGATPTYDALTRAAAMLTAATKNGAIPGSVILLTDGEPFPATQEQQSAVTADLVPQFKVHNWPVDVIALGADSGFRGFLSGLASATSGSLYDDGHGVVPGVSPLNITPFFLDIFRLRNGRSPGPDIEPTPLNGGAAGRNFTVGQFVKSLDIVVVKDSPSTRVTLVAPNGERFPPATAGTFVSTDPYYAIF
ncbi:MAG TPA: vWA domain-containing protein, partial [Ktedonobacterales bacterium]|nr:vWA domain-containing protein [Ktedonobacterales bacterium]